MRHPTVRPWSLLLLLAACASEPPPPPSPGPGLAPAPPAEPRAEADPFYGVVVSRDSKLVTADVDGRIVELAVRDGQRVAAGATLAVIDDGELRSRLDAARGAEDTAIGELRRNQSARAEAGRIARQQKSLLRDGAVSRDVVSSARSAYAIADAQVDAAAGAVQRARAAREQAERDLASATITAPIDGVITLIRVAEGQVVGRGQSIGRIFDPGDLWVRFAVPPERRDDIAVGQRIAARSPRGGDDLVATVRVVNRTLEPPLQFAVVEADLDEVGAADRDAMLGTMVDVRP
jgi:RND family efflux transporter MFP subunit